MTVKSTQVFTTTDGKTFGTRKEAEAHQKYVTRKAAVEKALSATFDLSDTTTIGVAGDFVALHGDAFLAALTIKANRGPRKVAAK